MMTSIRSIAHKNAAGFTLVEIMVAMVISLVILGGAISVLLQNQRNYRQNDDFGRLQENARFALDLITGDLRMTGFMGCTKNNSPEDQTPRIRSKLLNVVPGGLLDVSFYIDGWEDTAAGTWAASGVADPDAASIDAEILPGTDAITLRRLRNRGVPITENMATKDAPISVINTPVNVGEIAAIYNCESTDIFQAIAGTGPNLIVHMAGTSDPGNSTNDLGQAYTQNPAYVANPAADLQGNSARTFVAGFDAVRYYIAEDNGRPALWRQFYDGVQISRQALVEGIENMQILYGVDGTAGVIDGAPDIYTTADAVTDWNQVVAVKLNLLVSTIDEYGGEQDTKTYDIHGTPDNTADDLPAPMDRRLRKLVSATVMLRNMQARLRAG